MRVSGARNTADVKRFGTMHAGRHEKQGGCAIAPTLATFRDRVEAALLGAALLGSGLVAAGCDDQCAACGYGLLTFRFERPIERDYVLIVRHDDFDVSVVCDEKARTEGWCSAQQVETSFSNCDGGMLTGRQEVFEVDLVVDGERGLKAWRGRAWGERTELQELCGRESGSHLVQVPTAAVQE